MQWPLLFVPAFSVILKCQALVQREDIVYARVCATTDPHSRNFKMWEMSSGSTFQELVLRFGRVSWTRLLDHGCLQDDIALSTCGILPGPSTTGEGQGCHRWAPRQRP